MIREQIANDLRKACQKLGLSSQKVEMIHPSDPKFGDYSTNLPLQQQKHGWDKGWQSLEQIAKEIIVVLGKPDYLEKIEIVAPGFINFFLSKSFLQSQVGQILEKRQSFTTLAIGKGKKARIEFVSANPTGPLHIGNARGGPIGDVIASILETVGYKVLREYLHNDIGGQVDKFGQSLSVAAKGESLENLEYKGSYISELAKIIGVSTPETAAKKGVELMLTEIIADCVAMGVKFDKIYKESQFEEKFTDETLKKLKDRGVLKEYQGAVWFAPNDQYLRDKEAVVIKSDGEKTYFANDIAYHNLKFSQGYDLVIDELGSGHDGHIPKLKSAISSLGHSLEKFKVVVHQNVRVKAGSEIIKMSKRAGNIVTAREVLDEVGRDAFRFFMLMPSSSTHMDFDLELAKKQASDNPVYYVQYAHARICSILEKARSVKEPNFSLLNHPAELGLIKQLIKLPEILADISGNFQVQMLPNYALATATFFHKFYEQCRVISDDKDLTSARLGLVCATRIILGHSLKLLGVSAPEKM